ncbi:hypothetical protein M0P65_06980 [Candidatus Gracilibacteria bacterium]|jgi:ABC-type long-subunit fatty acid transport system fused permease/ATPase subunit|nr:hypothetical protein [Candidatus Gracilibacteria bacterium]
MINEKSLDKALRELEKTDKKYYMILYLYVNYPFVPITRLVQMTKENVLRNVIMVRNNKTTNIPTDIKKKLDKYIVSVKGKYLFSENGKEPIKPYKVYKRLKEIEKEFKIINLNNLESRKQYAIDRRMEKFGTFFNVNKKNKIIELF